MSYRGGSRWLGNSGRALGPPGPSARISDSIAKRRVEDVPSLTEQIQGDRLRAEESAATKQIHCIRGLFAELFHSQAPRDRNRMRIV